MPIDLDYNAAPGDWIKRPHRAMPRLLKAPWREVDERACAARILREPLDSHRSDEGSTDRHRGARANSHDGGFATRPVPRSAPSSLRNRRASSREGRLQSGVRR